MKILPKTCVVSTLLLSMTTFSFAQDKYSADDVKGSIVFYTHWTNMIENGDMAKWVDTFKKKYPNVEDIQVQGIGRYASTMSTRLATGDYGDVMEVTAQTLPNAELGDFFLPLNDMNLSKDMYFPDQWGYEGKEYAYTYGVNIEAVVYNKAAFAKAGIKDIPTTRTQLFADAEKLKAAGIIPFVSNMGTGWALVAYDGLAAAISGSNDFAGDLMKDKTPFSATQPYGQSFSVLREFIDRDLTESDLTTDNWNKSRGWMASGKAGMWFLGNWSINQIANEGATSEGLKPLSLDELGFFPLPYNDTGKYNINSGPDYAMVVSKHTKNPMLAKAWIDFILTKTDLSQKAGFIPGYKKLEPTLPQLKEVMSYKPTLVYQVPPSAKFTEAMNLIGFQNGSTTRDLMYKKDYQSAIDRLNQRWANAVRRVQR